MEQNSQNDKIRRGHVKAKLTRFETFLNNIDLDNFNDNVIKELNNRLQKVQGCYEEFFEIQSSIEFLFPDEKSDIEVSDFENRYFKLIAQAENLLESQYNKNTVTNVNNVDQGSGSGASSRIGSNDIKLPIIKLPVFKGHYNEWLQFRDLFLALVDQNQGISAIQKFYYLKTSLSDEPLKIIATLDTTAVNYNVAWDLLKERYENKSLMVHNHIKAIFEKPNLSKESHVELRELLDSITDHLLSLKSLGENVDSWDRLMIYIITQKFDKVTRRAWETFKTLEELPKMQDMRNFLKERCQMLEKLALDKAEDSEKIKYVGANKAPNKFKKFVNSSHSFHTDSKEVKCYFCEKGHTMYNCDEFLKLPIAKRIEEVKKRKFCLICFSPNHDARECKFKRCFKCNKAHNSLIHFENVKSNNFVSETRRDRINKPMLQNASANNNEEESLSAKVTDNNCFKFPVAEQVLLSTAIMKLQIGDKMFKARVLLDCGSMSSFVTESLCEKLNIDKIPINHTVKGVGQGTIKIRFQANLNLMSFYNDFAVNVNCLIINKITDSLPKISFDKSRLNIPKGIRLADPDFNVSSDIDILLGSQVFWSILTNGQKSLGLNLPVLQNSVLGWIISGNLGITSSSSLAHFTFDTNSDFNSEINTQIEQFWKIEEVQNKSHCMSNDEKYCEDFFENTIKYDDTGRLIVKIPFKDNVSKLGKSRDIAINSFLRLEKRLLKNIDLKVEYSKFMFEYCELGHMTEIPDDNDDGYFIPHHCVVKESSLTTRCRVVFNASCPTDNGLSLNDVQYIGPSLQNDIFDILIRFRKYKYVIAGDISKMYRQILIDPVDRKFQKIFWRFDPNEELKCYELNTLTYGMACSPYLAVKSLMHIAQVNSIEYPIASDIIKQAFYIDDLLSGGHSKSEVLQIQRDVSTILASSGFQLRKWLCNDADILNEFYFADKLDNNVLPIGANENNKTLGIYWNASSDILQYVTHSNTEKQKITKRLLLSVICQVYDPLGLVNPFIVMGKLLIQELWKLKTSWDQEVPENIKLFWDKLENELPLINKLTIPRLCVFSDYLEIEFHGFSDASEKAYGAAIYIRNYIPNKGYFTNLLCSKSRVAPLKKISLPRLELCAAVLLANLSSKVCNAIQIKFNARFFWCDSTITLAWIRAETNVWKTFVANRVTEIQSLTDINEWHHVSTNDNPADLLSRGTTPQILSESTIWWHGPSFLCVEDIHGILNNTPDTNFEIPEKRKVSTILLSINHFDSIQFLISSSSNYLKLVRVTAYILRFKNNVLKDKPNRNFGVLTPEELDVALLFLVKVVQVECFPQEYNNLLHKKDISHKSKILSLSPFLHNGVIRVGGRLVNADISFQKKHPLILPKSHYFTELIIRYEHERLMHCGVQLLLCSLRETFWPISAKNVCKKIVRQCVRCFRVQPENSTYLMGNLPDFRVNESLPYLNVGVDFGGPFLIKDRQGRGAKKFKCYICLFICMSTKAIHLELVTALTTNAFLLAFKRFISRRGKPYNVYSDNGSNFIGANRELKELYEFLKVEYTTFANNLLKDKIKWHFIPPRSPNFGGIWEAGIKNVKFHLKRVVGESVLTYEHFNTILIQIECILNARPLCPLTSDPDDLTPLTPSHLLIGRSLIALPEGDVTNINFNRLNQYQQIQSIIQSFWKRWHKEYLLQLQVRTRWNRSSVKHLKVGTLVIVKEDNVPSLHWTLGRITNVFPGTDGTIRVVEIKTINGFYKRAVNKVCVLPIS